jgi:PmbA protein
VIERLLHAVAGRVAAADAVTKTDATVTVSLDDEGRVTVTESRSEVSHLRITRDGRVAAASGTDLVPHVLAERALTDLPEGEQITLHFPAPAPLPGVMTRSPQAAVAGPEALLSMLRPFAGRLARTSRRVEVWAERSSGLVRVGNTRGVLAEYEASTVGVGAVIESIGTGAAPPCRLHVAGATMPSLVEIEGLVAEADRRLDPPPVESHGVPARMPVCFAPRALAVLLLPLRAALLGREALLGGSPIRGRNRGEPLFDARFSLVDDALVPARPGSRPIDDDGVVSRRVDLVREGRLAAMAADLRIGALAGVPSTGNGWRPPFGPPRVGFTNLLVRAGEADRSALLAPLSPGLLVEDLDWGPGPNPLTGAILARAPWAYLVEQGEVRGRVEGVSLTGNVFDLLTRVVAVGSDATWVGSWCAPSMVFEGVGVVGR